MSARAWLVVELDPAPGGGAVVVGETVTRQAADVLAESLAGSARASARRLSYSVEVVDDEHPVSLPRASRVYVSDAVVARIVDGVRPR